MSTALTVSGVHKTYESDRDVPVRALRGLDLSVEHGEFVAVTGPSGCGKSTLLHVIAGLESPDEGSVVIDGDAMSDAPDKTAQALLRRRHIGMVFQSYNLLDELSVLENVALPAVVDGAKRRAAEARARDLLSLLGIAERGDASPAVLSGGQRQRLAIARALANDPTLLLADEPTGALDSEGSAEITELFARLHRDGQTILMVTHDAAIARAASRPVGMADGRVVPTDLDASSGTGPVRVPAS